MERLAKKYITCELCENKFAVSQCLFCDKYFCKDCSHPNDIGKCKWAKYTCICGRMECACACNELGTR